MTASEQERLRDLGLIQERGIDGKTVTLKTCDVAAVLEGEPHEGKLAATTRLILKSGVQIHIVADHQTVWRAVWADDVVDPDR